MPRSTTRSNPPPGPRHVGLPLAGQPICSSSDALAVVSLAIQRPLVAETIAFFLDEASTSNTITIVTGTTEPDSVLSVAECMALAAGGSPSLCGVVLATVRPDTHGYVGRRHRPMARRRFDHRVIRDRADRVVHHRSVRVSSVRVTCSASRNDGERPTGEPSALRGSVADHRLAIVATVRDSMSARRRRSPGRRSTPRERRSDPPGTRGAGSLPARRSRVARRSSRH